jgi:hypothetical protein
VRSRTALGVALACAATLLVGCSDGDGSSLNGGRGYPTNGGGTNGGGTNGSAGSSSQNGNGAGSGSASSASGSGGASDNGGSSNGGSGNGGATSFGDEAVMRAREWVTAQVPYCGGPNGGNDVLCGGTCTRSGDAANPDWDAYRSDCSGLVSFAWQLPPPGHITSGFAPFATDVSDVIAVADLQPGDALNNDTHVMLFAAWKDDAKTQATIIQESDCGKVANETTVELTYADGDQKADVKYYGTFYAIRHSP